MDKNADDIFEALVYTVPVVLTLFIFLLGLVVHNVVRFMWLSD